MSGRAYSPPPPPQRRRSSLTMSGTTLSSLLRTAPVPRTGPTSIQLRGRTRPSSRGPSGAAAAGQGSLTSQLGLASVARLEPASPRFDLQHDLARRVMESMAASRAMSVPAPVASLPTMLTPQMGRRSSSRLSRKKAAPTSDQKRPAKRLKTSSEPPEPCCICMSTPAAEDAATIDCNCQNSFCFGCIQEWSKTENSCPLCKARFTSIESEAATAQVKTANQRSEAGAALEGLLASLTANTHQHRLGRFLLRSMNGPDEDPFMPGFMNVILRSTVTTHLHMSQFSTHDHTTGRSAETAIELDDSDDEDGLI